MAYQTFELALGRTAVQRIRRLFVYCNCDKICAAGRSAFKSITAFSSPKRQGQRLHVQGLLNPQPSTLNLYSFRGLNLINPKHRTSDAFEGQCCTINWVAVKELKLSYHNGHT